MRPTDISCDHMRLEEFEVTPEHISLSRRMWVNYSGCCEFGSPEVDPKRPYGNSSVYMDMAEILGVEYDSEDESWPQKEVQERFGRLHVEMATVLQIGLRTGRFLAGKYRSKPYSGDWELDKQ